MKVVQNCTVGATPDPVFAQSLNVGTVYKAKQSTNTYLRTSSGVVNLSTNEQFGSIGAHEVDIIYPNARVVLE